MSEAIRAARAPSSRATPLGVYYAIFTLSGFTGLIYESIWSHYLKLLLGHAAYAQTVVLTVFMGGLAVGSWWAGQASSRWSRLLLGYALVEAAIGVCALGFHPLFVATTDAFQAFVASSSLGPLGIDLGKWSLAAVLIESSMLSALSTIGKGVCTAVEGTPETRRTGAKEPRCNHTVADPGPPL